MAAVFLFGMACAASSQAALNTMRASPIGAEIEKIGPEHPWAGYYYFGDKLAINLYLAIAPQSGYAFEWHGCLGKYGQGEGKILDTNAPLRLSGNVFALFSEMHSSNSIVIPVRWGERRYLIPSGDMIEFCNAVNAGTEPRSSLARGYFYLREGDEDKKCAGDPPVPKEFKKFLLQSPVSATITKVLSTPNGTNGFFATSALVNAGSKQGLIPGMKLHVIYPNAFEEAIVKRTEAEQCEVEFEQLSEDRLPQEGWKVSTRLR
jgi:hypothetical protein